jgi:hypothetical protein
MEQAVITTSPIRRQACECGCEYRSKPLRRFVQNHCIVLRTQAPKPLKPAPCVYPLEHCHPGVYPSKLCHPERRFVASLRTAVEGPATPLVSANPPDAFSHAKEKRKVIVRPQPLTQSTNRRVWLQPGHTSPINKSSADLSPRPCFYPPKRCHPERRFAASREPQPKDLPHHWPPQPARRFQPREEEGEGAPVVSLASALALAFLSVIPPGNLLLTLTLPKTRHPSPHRDPQRAFLARWGGLAEDLLHRTTTPTHAEHERKGMASARPHKPNK